MGRGVGGVDLFDPHQLPESPGLEGPLVPIHPVNPPIAPLASSARPSVAHVHAREEIATVARQSLTDGDVRIAHHTVDAGEMVGINRVMGNPDIAVGERLPGYGRNFFARMDVSF